MSTFIFSWEFVKSRKQKNCKDTYYHITSILVLSKKLSSSSVSLSTKSFLTLTKIEDGEVKVEIIQTK